jgi:hypothetical protein
MTEPTKYSCCKISENIKLEKNNPKAIMQFNETIKAYDNEIKSRNILLQFRYLTRVFSHGKLNFLPILVRKQIFV